MHRSPIELKPSDHRKDQNSKSILHVLAVAEFWWHSQALDYLLTAGANMELQRQVTALN